MYLVDEGKHEYYFRDYITQQMVFILNRKYREWLNEEKWGGEWFECRES